jgi:hypothetical protein
MKTALYCGGLLMALCFGRQPAAWAAATAPQRGVQNELNIPHVSGGIGSDEQQSMHAVRNDYNLRLTFAVQGSGAYLSDVSLLIFDAAGKQVLYFDSAGPLFFARLAPGHYRVQAAVRGKAMLKSVTLGAAGARELYFYWDAAPDSADGGAGHER